MTDPISDLAIPGGAIILVLGGWYWAQWEYRRVHHRRLRWWAVPLALGALLLGRPFAEWFHTGQETET